MRQPPQISCATCVKRRRCRPVACHLRTCQGPIPPCSMTGRTDPGDSPHAVVAAACQAVAQRVDARQRHRQRELADDRPDRRSGSRAYFEDGELRSLRAETSSRPIAVEPCKSVFSRRERLEHPQRSSRDKSRHGSGQVAGLSSTPPDAELVSGRRATASACATSPGSNRSGCPVERGPERFTPRGGGSLRR
jgi:hypothetical protein